MDYNQEQAKQQVAQSMAGQARLSEAVEASHGEQTLNLLHEILENIENTMNRAEGILSPVMLPQSPETQVDPKDCQEKSQFLLKLDSGLSAIQCQIDLLNSYLSRVDI